ncbi:MAG: Flp pilus assembly complex ATPase component TadA [Burkholderiales bacterium]|nr:Flp pilus assembly complex ATPase component TadA [Burkholderiales bacterium]
MSEPHLVHDYKLGEVLVHNGVITPENLHDALVQQRIEAQAHAHRPLGQILLRLNAITESDLQVALAATMSMPVVDCSTLSPEREALALVSREMALRAGVLPLLLRHSTLVVAMDDPWQRAVLDELSFLTNRRVLPVMAAPGTVESAITRAYDELRCQTDAEHGADINALAQALAQDVPELLVKDSSEVITESSNALVRLVNKMIEDAVQRHASDIHIESALQHDTVRIRFRVDGTLVPYLELPPRYRHALVARIKIMSDLDIAEHRKPQDGKVDFARFGGTAMELRVVTVPTAHGQEDVVLRLLAGAKPLPLAAIGLNEHNLVALRQSFAKPYGLILICGPTGCGKTTSLHSVLRELNDGERKIWTAEDPIEITQAGLCQVQVNPRIGWTFAAAMRTFLRADPDVIMIGEMRDEETARIAIEASLTGHLVFSTLHTNSAAESIARLLEIGLDPFNFSDSLLAVLAQRLVRRLCPQCSRPELASSDAIDGLLHEYLHSARDASSIQPDTLLADWRHRFGDEQGRLRLRHKQGCVACNQRGYKGRLGLHELLVADDPIRQQIRHRAAAADILQSALNGGMQTLRQDGIEKVLQGLTDMSEVIAASNT